MPAEEISMVAISKSKCEECFNKFKLFPQQGPTQVTSPFAGSDSSKPVYPPSGQITQHPPSFRGDEERDQQESSSSTSSSGPNNSSSSSSSARNTSSSSQSQGQRGREESNGRVSNVNDSNSFPFEEEVPLLH